jgi:integrase
MARGPKPTVRYWSSRKAYACWIGQTRHFLARGPDDAPSGPTYLAALDQFRKLVAQDDGKGTDDYLISALMNQYRAHLKASRKSGAPGVFEIMARGFTAKHGKLKVRDLKPHMVETWLSLQDNWNNTTKAHAGTLILASVSWARKKGFIQTDPLAGRVELPQPVLRGRDARMSEELMDLLIDEARRNKMRSQEFADLLWVLRTTGARPGEIRAAEAFNYEKGKLIFRWNAPRGYIWKNAKKTQRDRVIFLTPEVRAHVEKLVAAKPKGLIFRTPRDAGWLATSIGNKWRWLVQRPRVLAYCKEHDIDPGSLKPYNFRHSWACNYLDTTGDIFGAAMMLGTSVKMLQTRYFHMDMDKLHERFLAYHHSQQAAKASA